MSHTDGIEATRIGIPEQAHTFVSDELVIDVCDHETPPEIFVLARTAQGWYL
jgi:hypothetical protein